MSSAALMAGHSAASSGVIGVETMDASSVVWTASHWVVAMASLMDASWADALAGEMDAMLAVETDASTAVHWVEQLADE